MASLLYKETEELNKNFLLLLDELVKTFPNSKLNPDKTSTNLADTNQELYDDTMRKMMKLQNDFFIFKNEVMRMSDFNKAQIKDMDDKVDKIDSINKKLKDKLAGLKSSSYSAEGLFDDTQISRNELLYGNIFLFFVVLLGGIRVYKQT